jgi:hypothetical protein
MKLQIVAIEKKITQMLDRIVDSGQRHRHQRL